MVVGLLLAASLASWAVPGRPALAAGSPTTSHPEQPIKRKIPDDPATPPKGGATAPTAHLTVSPPSGAAPLPVTLDASASSDLDGGPLRYTFDFGDGYSAGPQALPTATHSYGAGLWFASVTVEDPDGRRSTVETMIAVNSTPVTAMTVAPTTGIAPLTVTVDASGSYDPDGDGLVYWFDFGDGSVAGPTPDAVRTHTYGPGQWTVRVTASDEWGMTSSAIATVQVAANGVPSVVLNVSPLTGTSPLLVTLDASGSRDPEGGALAYRFEFGDGVALGPQAQGTATHLYSAGTWKARVTVTDPLGAVARDSVMIGVNAPPVASLAATPASGLSPLVTTLDARASSDPEGGRLLYRFELGDGTIIGPQAQPTVAHTYAAGRWTALVTVTDSVGATRTTSLLVVSNVPPVARLTASPASGVTPLLVTANASASTDAEGGLTYRFDFGDGVAVGPQPQATASHVYAAGDWALRVTVTDIDGATDTSAVPVHVDLPPNQLPLADLIATPGAGNAPLPWDPLESTCRHASLSIL